MRLADRQRDDADHRRGNLTISGSGTYSFASVYVTGNVTISGTTRFRFGSLYVGGSLTMSGATAVNLGPTYVAGNTTVSGSGQWNAETARLPCVRRPAVTAKAAGRACASPPRRLPGPCLLSPPWRCT